MTPMTLRNDPLFADFFRMTRPAPRTGSWQPFASLTEETEAWKLEVELPGLSPEQVDVSFDRGILTVKGEGRRGPFERYARVGGEVDEGAIDATLENGLLTVTVPKRAPQETLVRVPVKG